MTTSQKLFTPRMKSKEMANLTQEILFAIMGIFSFLIFYPVVVQ